MYDIMTPGPTQVRENVLAARALPCTNPDLDPDFFTFYKETCEHQLSFAHRESDSHSGRRGNPWPGGRLRQPD